MTEKTQIDLPVTSALSRFAGELWAIHEEAIPRYLNALSSQEGGREFAVTSLPTAALADSDAGYITLGSTAVFIVAGVMVPGGYARWAECDTTKLTAAFLAATADPAVKQGLVLLNTPGGMVLGQDLLMEAVKGFAAKKTLTGQVEQMCCSGGYWLLSQCENAYAGPFDTIGSIGVRAHVWDWSKYFAEVGVEVVSFSTGAFKAMGLQGTEVTEDQRKFGQDRVDYLFRGFKADVMAGREMSEEQFANVGDGRYWFGEQAVGLGLIDKVRRTAETIAALPAAQPTTKGSRAMADNNTEVTQPEAPKAVTTAELKSKFPNSTAEWREEQVEAKATLADAAVSYANLQEKKAKDAEAAQAAAEAAAKEAAVNAGGRGVAPLAGGGGGEDEPSVDYRAEAAAIEKACGVSRAVAQHRVVSKYGKAAVEAFKIGKLPGV